MLAKLSAANTTDALITKDASRESEAVTARDKPPNSWAIALFVNSPDAESDTPSETTALRACDIAASDVSDTELEYAIPPDATAAAADAMSIAAAMLKVLAILTVASPVMATLLYRTLPAEPSLMADELVKEQLPSRVSTRSRSTAAEDDSVIDSLYVLPAEM